MSFKEIPSIPTNISEGIALSAETELYHPKFIKTFFDHLTCGERIRLDLEKHANGMPLYLVGSSDKTMHILWINGDNYLESSAELDLVGGALTTSPDRAGANTHELTILCPFADLRGHKRTRKRMPDSQSTAIVKAEGITDQVLADKMSHVAHAKNVVFVDMHNPSESTPWFENAGLRVINLTTNSLLARYLLDKGLIKDPKSIIVASTDPGNLYNSYDLSKKISHVFNQEIQVPLIINKKTRINDEQVIQNLECVDLTTHTPIDMSGKTVVVADDMISGAVTTIDTVNHLLENNADHVIFYATHAVFTKDYYANLSMLLDDPRVTIIVSDTLPFIRKGQTIALPYGKPNNHLNPVKILPVATWLAEKASVILSSFTLEDAYKTLHEDILDPVNPYEFYLSMTQKPYDIKKDEWIYLGQQLFTPIPELHSSK
jgi:hypothetical protein